MLRLRRVRWLRKSTRLMSQRERTRSVAPRPASDQTGAHPVLGRLVGIVGRAGRDGADGEERVEPECVLDLLRDLAEDRRH